MKMSQIYSRQSITGILIKFCDTVVTYKESWLYHSILVGNSRMIALYEKGIVQNMEDDSKDLQNASTQHMLTPRKSYL